ALRVVRTVVGNHEHIESNNPSFLRKTGFHPALKTGPGSPDESFLFATDAHHYRGVGLLREERRDDHRDAAGYLAAEPAARVFADEDDFRKIHIQPTCEGRPSLRRTLSAGINVDFAVLPISHRAASLQSLVTGVRCDERLVQDERCIVEAGIEVAVRPFVRRFAHRQPAALELGEIRMGPLELRDRGRLRTWWLRPDVAVRSRVRTAGAQTIQRIDDKWKPF